MIYQKSDRDCFQATLANLLKIPYEDIPKFYEGYPENLEDWPSVDSDNFNDSVNSWLSAIGLGRMYFPIQNREDGSVILPYSSEEEIRFVGLLQKPNRHYSHAVLITITGNEIRMFDPKRDSDYTIEDLTHLEFYYKGGWL